MLNSIHPTIAIAFRAGAFAIDNRKIFSIHVRVLYANTEKRKYIYRFRVQRRKMNSNNDTMENAYICIFNLQFHFATFNTSNNISLLVCCHKTECIHTTHQLYIRLTATTLSIHCLCLYAAIVVHGSADNYPTDGCLTLCICAQRTNERKHCVRCITLHTVYCICCSLSTEFIVYVKL